MEEILEQVHRMKSLSKKYAKEQEKFNQKMQTIKENTVRIGSCFQEKIRED